jgi:hypothetical protein
MTDLVQENLDLNALNVRLESALLQEQREGENKARTIVELRRNQRREWDRVGHMAEVIDIQDERHKSDLNEIEALTREVRRLKILNIALQMSRAV